MSRRRTRTNETNANVSSNSVNDDLAQIIHTQKKMSDYEQSREDRIKENLEKLQKLGIFDLSLMLKSQTRPKRAPKSFIDHKTPASPLPSSGPIRRSSRLQLLKKYKAFEVCSKLDIYIEKHEKLLDGYGKNGVRIYDSIKGKTCHQCRQKTLGYRTHCSRCDLLQGQFCEDCLYNRYGENMHEALENPDWICPPCRGICNCSLCRNAKGWAPTGALYRKISKMGYKSVAHYLIQTDPAETKFGESTESSNQVIAKRSLSFLDTDAATEEPNDVKYETSDPPIENNEGSNSSLPAQIYAKRSLPFSEPNEKDLDAEQEGKETLVESKEFQGKDLNLTSIKHDGDGSKLVLEEGTPLLEKPCIAIELNSDSSSIAARLKRRRQEGCSSSVVEKL